MLAKLKHTVVKITPLFFMISCSHLHKKPMPLFHPEKDCNPEDLQYLNSTKPHKTRSKVLNVKVEKLMKLISKDIRKCYQDEIDRGNPNSYNLCFISGYNKQGKIEYFSFSSQRNHLSRETKECLLSLKIDKKFSEANLKDVKIIQPYQLIRP